jgi:hypothetical protein
MPSDPICTSGKGSLERAARGIDFMASAIGIQDRLGSPCQQAADFAAISLDPWDRYLVIGRCSVTHPGNDGGLGALLDGNPLGPPNG